MKRKIVTRLLAATLIAATITTTGITASAAELKTNEKTSVDTTSSSSIMKSLRKQFGADTLWMVSNVFDAEYYATTNPDVVAAFGDDAEMMLAHYLLFGMYEDRNASEDFNATVYGELNEDVKKAFSKLPDGSDMPQSTLYLNYFFHYQRFGKDEGRTATAATAPKKPTTTGSSGSSGGSSSSGSSSSSSKPSVSDSTPGNHLPDEFNADEWETVCDELSGVTYFAKKDNSIIIFKTDEDRVTFEAAYAKKAAYEKECYEKYKNWLAPELPDYTTNDNEVIWINEADGAAYEAHRAEVSAWFEKNNKKDYEYTDEGMPWLTWSASWIHDADYYDKLAKEETSETTDVTDTGAESESEESESPTEEQTESSTEAE